MTSSLLLEHLDDLIATSEDVEQLDTFILQLGLQGKLVEQNASDESGLELLKRIYAEMTEHSKNRHLAPMKESDEPFDLPAGWAWARLGDIIQISSGKSLTKEQMNEAGRIPVYGGNGITGYHDEALVYQKTIVIGRVGFYCGSVHLTEDKAWVTDNAFITTYPEKYIHREYLIWLLRGTNLKENQNATAQPVISGRKVYPIIIGIPPLLEQKRIAARLEELFAQTHALAKELAYSQSELDDLNKSALSHLLASETPPGEFNQHWHFVAEHFDLLFQAPEHVAPLRQSILELAVRGKLTRREAGDEAAKELLKHIREEKEKQGVTQSQLKIRDEEKTFELPEGWEWCHTGDLFLFTTSGSRGWAKYYSDDGPVFLRIGNLDYESIDLDLRNIQRVQPPQTVERERIRVQPGDILISMTGDVGMTAVVKDGELAEAYINQHIGLNRPSQEVLPAFLGYTFISPHGLSQLFKSRKGIKNSLALNDMTSVIIALPPLAEQERIVKRVEQLLSLCDALESRLQSAEEERGRLVAAVMSTVGG